MTKPVKYLFVDGGYFEILAKNIIDVLLPGFDPFEYVDFARISREFDRSFYYDSYPADNSADYELKRSRKEKIFESINLTPNFRVNYGASEKWNRRRGMQQKGLDVLLAIEVFQHAAAGNMDIASIITGDLDFLPLFEALSRTRVKTELLFESRSTSIELMHAADQVRPLTMAEFLRWTTVDKIKSFQIAQHSGDQLPSDLINVRRGKIGDDEILIGKSPALGTFVAYIVGQSGFKTCKNEHVLRDSYFRLPNDQVVLEPL